MSQWTTFMVLIWLAGATFSPFFSADERIAGASLVLCLFAGLLTVLAGVAVRGYQEWRP